MNQTQPEPVQVAAPAVDDFLFHSADWAYRRRKGLIRLAIALVVGIVAVYGVLRWQQTQQIARAQALHQLQAKIQKADLAASAALTQFQSEIEGYLQAHAGTNEAHILLLQRANLRMAANQLAVGEQDLRNLIAELDPQAGLYPLVVVYLANGLRDQNKGEDAARLLLDAKTKRMSEVLLIELAETYFSLGKLADAKAVLTELQGQFPQGHFSEQAQLLQQSM